jgi:hypothetical protein
MARLLFIAVLVVVSGCSGAPTAPSAPSSVPSSASSGATPTASTDPAPAKHTVWAGSRTLSSVAGGECVGPVLAALIGSVSPYDLQVTQNGSSVTGVATDRKTGFSMNYVGTANGPSMSLTPAKMFYTPGTFPPLENFACGGAQVRDVGLNTSTISASVSGNTLTGTVVDEYYVYLAWMVGDTRHYTYITDMVLTSRFVLAR